MNARIESATAACALLALASACATYEPAPLNPAEVLAGLRAVEWSSAELDSGAGGAAPAAGPRELAGFALRHNPQLAALRAATGVRGALLVEAGLLPDPELGWDAMNVVASQVVAGGSSRIDVLSGLGLMFPLLRPGERDARVGVAEWEAAHARRLVTAGEWTLTREVHVAFEEARGAERLSTQTRALADVARSTADFFERAREAGAATAIQANLALGQLQGIRLEQLRAEARERRARQALNALLGLPPGAELELGAAEQPSDNAVLGADLAALTDHALGARPDLSALTARYAASEEAVRLAVSMQYPLLALGSGIQLTLPLFSRFGRPALATARARRERVARDYAAAVHGARQEIAAAQLDWAFAEREVRLVEDELLPNAERNLELSDEALRAGEVTLLETLALQRALVEARTRRVEARAERAKRAWTLLAASGHLLAPEPTPAASLPAPDDRTAR